MAENPTMSYFVKPSMISLLLGTWYSGSVLISIERASGDALYPISLRSVLKLRLS